MRLSWLLRTVSGVLRDKEILIGGTGDEPPSSTDDVLDELEDTSDEIDELTETLIAHSILSEERHAEILQRIETCQIQLMELRANTQAAEIPALTQLLSEMGQIQGQLTALQTQAQETQVSLRILQETRSESHPPAEPPPGNVEDHPEAVIEPPSNLESPPPPSEAPPKPERKTRMV